MTTKLHGFLDYLMVVLFILCGFAFEFPDRLQSLPFILAAIHFGLTFLTKFPYGAVKIIPFRLHGFIELVAGAGLLIFAFTYFTKDRVLKTYYPTDETAHNFCLFFGVAILLMFLLTKYRSYR